MLRRSLHVEQSKPRELMNALSLYDSIHFLNGSWHYFKHLISNAYCIYHWKPCEKQNILFIFKGQRMEMGQQLQPAWKTFSAQFPAQWATQYGMLSYHNFVLNNICIQKHSRHLLRGASFIFRIAWPSVFIGSPEGAEFVKVPLMLRMLSGVPTHVILKSGQHLAVAWKWITKRKSLSAPFPLRRASKSALSLLSVRKKMWCFARVRNPSCLA